MNKNIKTKYYPINQPINAEYNPRQLTQDQYNQLKESIERFGLVDPLIINTNKSRKNVLIGGHQRLKIARDLGLKSIPCVEIDLNYDQERELNIRLNKNLGDWDYEILANNFDIDELNDWGFKDEDILGYEKINDNNNLDLDVDKIIKSIKNLLYKVIDRANNA